MNEKVLGIYGAGGLGREVLELAKIINHKEKRWDRIIFIVDGATQKEVHGIQVFDYNDAKKKYGAFLEAAIGIGEPAVREKKFVQLKTDGIMMPALIHPSVYIPDTTSVGKGVVIQYGCFISCDVTIKNFVYIQPQCNIGHDAVLSEGCMISGFGNIAGTVNIGSYTYVGMSAAIREGVSVGNNSIIGMGSVVYKDVPDEMVAMGNPARPMSKNTDRMVFRH